jgi:ABC-type lipoprotein export system ATPase subunit
MLAIMGPSGAGKTTLLSLLAARNAKSVKMTGDVNLKIFRLKLMELSIILKSFMILVILFTSMIFYLKQ